MISRNFDMARLAGTRYSPITLHDCRDTPTSAAIGTLLSALPVLLSFTPICHISRAVAARFFYLKCFRPACFSNAISLARQEAALPPGRYAASLLSPLGFAAQELRHVPRPYFMVAIAKRLPGAARARQWPYAALFYRIRAAGCDFKMQAT